MLGDDEHEFRAGEEQVQERGPRRETEASIGQWGTQKLQEMQAMQWKRGTYEEV